MKHLLKAALFGLALSSSGCQIPGPVYDECILSVDRIGFNARLDDCLKSQKSKPCIAEAWDKSIVADCINSQNTSLYERWGASVDGDYTYPVKSRSNILTWGRANCRGK